MSLWQMITILGLVLVIFNEIFKLINPDNQCITMHTHTRTTETKKEFILLDSKVRYYQNNK